MNADKPEVIAERVLDFTAPDGTTGKIHIRMRAPVVQGDAKCYYEVQAPEFHKLRYAAGIDSFQAIQLALRIIDVEIRLLAREKNWKLSFYGCEDIGFSDYQVPPT